MSTAIVIDELYTRFENDVDVGIGFVYCNFRRKQEQNPKNLMASLLKQLLQGLPSMPNSLLQLYERHMLKKSLPSLEEIIQALQSISSEFCRVFIIVDALDECQDLDGGHRTFLAELFTLQSKVAANIFATSRFIPEVEKEFEGRGAQLEIRANHEDLERYLDGHMMRLPSFVLRSPDLQNEIKDAIIKAVDGMYVSSALS